jgi:S-formylglutathione hydrolase FrmB
VGRALARKQSLPAIYIDVGRDDRFLAQNRSFYAALAALNVRHVYRERPGAHDWNYWRANLPRSLAWLGTVIAK